MKKIIWCLFICCSCNVIAQTQTINLTTGNGAVGSPDPVWTVTLPGGGTQSPIIANGNLLNDIVQPTWLFQGYPVNSCGRWISPYTIVTPGPNFGAVPGAASSVLGNFIYTMNFNALNMAICNAQIVLNIAGGDNTLTNIAINGNNFPQNIGFSPLTSNVIINLTPGNINRGANNTISVTVNNTGAYTALLLCGSLTINYSGLSPAITGNSNFCVNAPLTFIGNSGPATVSNSFWEIAQCDQNGNVTQGGYVWNTWTGVSPGTYTFPNNVKPPCGKYYKVKLAVSNNCESWAETNKVIYIACNPVVNVSGPQAVCATSGTTLTASGANTYLWVPTNQTGNQVIVHPGTDCNPRCGAGNGTVYTVTGTNTYGCASAASITIVPLAQNLSIDISTGANPSPNLLSFGTQDPDWKVRGTPGNLNATASHSSLPNTTSVSLFSCCGTSWANGVAETWVTSHPNGTQPATVTPYTASNSTNWNKAAYSYLYENEFYIPTGVGYSNFNLTVDRITADNNFFFYLNRPEVITNSMVSGTHEFGVSGVSNNGSWNYQSFYGPYSVTSQSRFLQGTNRILVKMSNQEPNGCPNAVGLILHGTVTATCPIVEPCYPPGSACDAIGMPKVNDPKIEKATSSALIYPNPFNNNFNLLYDGEGEVKIEVMDVLGKTLLSQQGVGKEEINLKMSDAIPGMYLVKITAGGETIMKKVVKE